MRTYDSCFSALQRAENSSIGRRGASGGDNAASFSALQRAENSSIRTDQRPGERERQVSVLFSEPKIPQSRDAVTAQPASSSFSALQRAENSSIAAAPSLGAALIGFQCSSASRKFLNHTLSKCRIQRAQVSVLFSEPKIPQSRTPNASARCCWVSVLFSEPKIPQYHNPHRLSIPNFQFQCSSASRKFLNTGDRR